MSATLPAWQSGPAILSTLRQWKGSTLCDLPDEAVGESSEIRFAAGAWDGILGHHTAGVDEQEEARLVQRLLDAVMRLISEDDDAAREHLYDMLKGESLVRHIDVFLRELVEQDGIGPVDVLPHARWLVHNAAHRNPLKFGIALLGICGEPDDLDDLRLLARHDEFTLYAAVASANLVEDPVLEWWDMAQQVKGWGKVHLVERLCQHVGERDDLRGWLLRQGCVNEIMNEYLALDCATGGDLAGALASEDDEELLDGATLILQALLTENGPAGDLDNYPDAVATVDHYLRHMSKRCHTLERLQVVKQLIDWLSNDEEDVWDPRVELGWTPIVREELLSLATPILDRPHWPDRIRQTFIHNEAKRALAWEISSAIGIDLWEEAFALLHKKPKDSWLYSVLTQAVGTMKANEVIRFGEANLPLKEVATGPDNLLGLGSPFAVHNCIDALLTRMARGDVYSEPIIACALRSPVVRNRHLAATVLEGRSPTQWGTTVVKAFEQTRHDECNEQMKERWKTMSEQE